MSFAAPAESFAAPAESFAAPAESSAAPAESSDGLELPDRARMPSVRESKVLPLGSLTPCTPLDQTRETSS